MKRKKVYQALILLAVLILTACARQMNNEEKVGNTEPTPQSQVNHISHEPEISDQIEQVDQEIPQQNEDLRLAVRKIIPAVVGIKTVYQNGTEITESIGSGSVVDPSGFVITNDHVAGGNPDELMAVFHDGTAVSGTTLWSDPTLDLAVVKLDAENLPSAEFGNSNDLVVGQLVAAVGTPLSMQFQHTVTAGIVSALNRTISVPSAKGENFMEDLIQTDASINPGNSGGPLINYAGQVIGINTVKVSSAEGIGFAIPADVVKPIIKQFLEYGDFQTPYIGLVGYDKEIACYYEQCNNMEDGVYIASIDRGAPADQAGLKKGDVIIKLNGEPITKMWELRKVLYSNRVGDSVTVTYMEGTTQKETTLTLEVR